MSMFHVAFIGKEAAVNEVWRRTVVELRAKIACSWPRRGMMRAVLCCAVLYCSFQ